ncbi:flavin-containing monooxygenase [Microbacterium ureisolvens]|uniref:NAD(P)/FAD-dependent oxidoreductase n=1 Tax=Microbacterium ureisolvens TaxID=2781186 RepID=A0ABS7I5K3_9MICO|nr:NAD(P)/FAD-dependent oxidoreductase [Microbacterium ureisolvens]MBW9111902.1 NAD(P)/FAD-dependent oxidoreductase [Microbacterium ureisolvens]
MTEHTYDAVVLGAGYGGVGQAAQLLRNGIDNFVILERAPRIGGVWRDNTYPGAACDTQSVIYCFSYFLPLRVSKMYIDQPELLGYLEALAAEYDIPRYIRFGEEIVRAVWDDADLVWRITTAAGVIYRTRAFIPAWGQLSVPMIPDFPGLHDFRGTSFHSARWDHSVDMKGKKVASIGAAASAVQYIPHLAEAAEHLSVFQRSANYILPRNQHEFTPEETAEFLADPDKFRALRQAVHQFRESGFERIRHNTEGQEEGVREARAHLEAQVADPELRRKLTPDYEFGCKRILRSDNYYPALTRKNVSLITDRIERFTATGIITADGTHHEFDVVVFGTGFHSQSFQGDVEVIGRGGARLADRWADAAEAYLGIVVDDFPNMFLNYGPNTNLNHNTIATMLELQHEYIVQAIRVLLQDPNYAFDVRSDVLRAFNDRVQVELEKSSYSSDCSSWYKNAAGRVVNNWSGTVEEYRLLTESVNLDDYRHAPKLTSVNA